MIDAFGYVIYGALAVLAIWGVYNAVLLYRNLAKKGVKNEEAANLIGQVRDLTARGISRARSSSAPARTTGTRPWRSSSPWPCGSATRGWRRSSRSS